MSDDLKWALDTIHGNVAQYREPRAYYDGDHPLTFGSDKMREAFGRLVQQTRSNYCPRVVETFADRLLVMGFTVPKADKDTPDATEDRCREIWRRNRMDQRAGSVHLDTITDGDAYVIVWPDQADERMPILYPNRASGIAIHYDDEQPGYITRAAKGWRITDGPRKGFGRINLFYRDRIEKYISQSKLEGGMSDNPSVYKPFEIPGEAWPLPNQFGKVPVFHFANHASLGEMGQSELRDVIPLQDGLNKSLADRLVAMEFYALPQRWATGLQGGETGKLKPGGVWAVETADTKFGEFSPGDIAQFVLVADDFRKDIARVSGTPLYYFTMEGTLPSGEAIKTSEAPLTSKVTKAQVAFGNTWADVMRFGLQITGIDNADPETVWKDTTPRSETEQITNATAKAPLGVPRSQLLREIGYEKAQIEDFAKERATADVIPSEDL